MDKLKPGDVRDCPGFFEQRIAARAVAERRQQEMPAIDHKFTVAVPPRYFHQAETADKLTIMDRH